MDIVLDKSYLQAASTGKIQSLCLENNVLMPESLLYELLTTTFNEERTACFHKFPDTYDPVMLIPNVGTILRYEVKNRVPCNPVSQLAIGKGGRFNKKLRNGDYILPKDKVDNWMKRIRDEIEEFKQHSVAVVHWFPLLAENHHGQNTHIINDVLDAICNDENLIKRIYKEIRSPDFPERDSIDPDWMLFRWLQIHLFAAVEYIRRFGLNNSSDIMNSIEHDFLDIQYCITGVQVGALASMDKRMINMFNRICPNGLLICER